MKTRTTTNRRKFLLAAGLGGAGAAALTVAKLKPVAAGAKESAAEEGSTSYRDTEHIRKYYKTTQV